jgi:hypothetical protein
MDLSAADTATLRAVAAEFATIPERENTMAHHVGEDRARLAAAADVGAEELRLVLLRFPWDDALAHLHFQAVTLEGEPRTGFKARCHEAWGVLAALKAAYREPRPPDCYRERDEDPKRDEDAWLYDQRTEDA